MIYSCWVLQIHSSPQHSKFLILDSSLIELQNGSNLSQVAKSHQTNNCSMKPVNILSLNQAISIFMWSTFSCLLASLFLYNQLFLYFLLLV